MHKYPVKILAVLVAIGTAAMVGVASADENGPAWVGQVVSVQGDVTAKPLSGKAWTPVAIGDTFRAGDQIRVGANSRASVVLSNDAVLRLDQNTTLTFTTIEREKTFILQLIEGAANFFSHRPRSLKILTPFVNGVVEGTEFFVTVDAEKTRIDLFAGRITAENPYGSIGLIAGEGALATADGPPQRTILVKPRESVQWALYYPPILVADPENLGVDQARATALFQAGQTTAALATLEAIADANRDAAYHTLGAAMRLSVGRVMEAAEDIRQALALDSENANATALAAIIDVVQNRPTDGLTKARQAVERDAHSPGAHIVLSYALQATFDLEAALAAAEKAVNAAPDSALVWARLSELRLSTGSLDKGRHAARRAVELDPQNAHAHTIMGYAHLTRIDTEQARKAFARAIELDNAAPLPRLGLGLARIRDGDLASGRRDIEIAAGLDPQNSLMRSYLGKAYFDEKRDPMDGEQFEIAKTLDPNDPTPWFYDAIRKQSLNRPVEALHDLQKSISLNDNRAVYRSRLLLDEDLAARSAGLGQIYNDLGFQELALRQGWYSLSADPGNYSAHLLLADAYGARPRHEIARVSERLQAQLLQPLSTSPAPPQHSEANLIQPCALGTSDLSFNEYNPLFTRNRMRVQAGGTAGSNDTISSEIMLNGLYDNVSGTVGHYHYETDGFRLNNDVDQDSYNAFLQTAVTPRLNLQAEYRKKTVEHGDLPFYWDLETPQDPDYLMDETTTNWRAGLHYKTSTNADLIASLIYQDMEQDQSFPAYMYTSQYEGEGMIGEAQYIFRGRALDMIIGAGRYDVDAELTIDYPAYDINLTNDADVVHDNAYIYTTIRYPQNITWTAGLSYDALDHHTFDNIEQFNPKIGAMWHLSTETALRFAAFRCLKRSLIADQTLEPTQIAGFNQFYDDFNGMEYKVYGAGIDQRFANDLNGGVEYYLRDMNKISVDQYGDQLEEGWEEHSLRAYLYLTFASNLFLSAEYAFDWFDRESDTVDYAAYEAAPFEMKTQTAPVEIGYFHPSGIFGSFTTTYVHQRVTPAEDPDERLTDDFTLFDMRIGYRFRQRYGMLSARVNNVFNTGFNYYGLDTRTSHIETTSAFVPERTFLVQLSLAF